jgi:hypothetical protein
MAFQEIPLTSIDPPKKYLCVSTDTKPTDDVPVGSRALETDTASVYIFDGTAWATAAGLTF